MDMSAGRASEYLLELYNQVEGNIEKQASMYEIGSTLGLEKSEAGALAEELIMDELVELKTLAGGIGITSLGLEMLQKEGYVDIPSGNTFKLSGNPVLNVEDQEIIKKILANVQDGISKVSVDYKKLEEIVIDMKTIEVQLLSSAPKTTIVRAILGSLQNSLSMLQLHEIAAKLGGALE